MWPRQTSPSPSVTLPDGAEPPTSRSLRSTFTLPLKKPTANTTTSRHQQRLCPWQGAPLHSLRSSSFIVIPPLSSIFLALIHAANSPIRILSFSSFCFHRLINPQSARPRAVGFCGCGPALMNLSESHSTSMLLIDHRMRVKEKSFSHLHLALLTGDCTGGIQRPWSGPDEPL
ncbi:hypothetical protein IWX49DRAFT_377930 [Phyllosticta citricarpa]